MDKNMASFLAHCKDAKASCEESLKLFRTGELSLKAGTAGSGALVDVTSEHAEQLEQVVADLSRLIDDVEADTA